jgi:hypothetical protein
MTIRYLTRRPLRVMVYRLAGYIAMMKATIEFDDALYRRLKVEAARRGRTVRELVAEGVRHVLDSPPSTADASDTATWRPAWFGALGSYAAAVDDHSMSAVNRSVARRRASGPSQ